MNLQEQQLMANLIRARRWGALATQGPDGPEASWVAYVPEADFSGFLLHLSTLSGHTRNSLTQLPQLERELNHVRQYGVARDNEELELGVRCMAAGIYNDQGNMIAGLSISAPAHRIDESWMDKLRDAANQISTAIGYRGKHLTQR